jgi:hypothetical protein
MKRYDAELYTPIYTDDTNIEFVECKQGDWVRVEVANAMKKTLESLIVNLCKKDDIYEMIWDTLYMVNNFDYKK